MFSYMFQQSNTTPSTVIAQIPSLLFQIGASEVDKDQHSEIIMIGFTDGWSALADEISGFGVGRKNFNLCMTAVLHVPKHCDFGKSET